VSYERTLRDQARNVQISGKLAAGLPQLPLYLATTDTFISNDRHVGYDDSDEEDGCE
jgi:hypothetical protein